MTDLNFQPRRENLIRATAPGELTMTGNTLFGHFARFNEWNLIDSAIEGRFMERLHPAAFDKTLTGRTPKTLFQHGKDPQIGDKVITGGSRFATDDIGPTLEGELLDGLDPLLVSGLRAGAYGMSYRFSIPNKDAETWVRNAPVSGHNPLGLPERTIREVMVYEAGPVTWPADAGTDAGVRSLTDLYTLDALAADPDRLRALVEAKQANALEAPEPALATPTAESRSDPPPIEAPTVIPKDPPEGGSSDSREETPVSEYTSREDKASRVIELRSSLSALAIEYPGVLPPDAQARWDAETAEQDSLEADIVAWDKRQARITRDADDPKRTETATSTAYAPPVVKRTLSVEDIHDIGKIRSESRTGDEFRTRVRENALRSIDGTRFPKGTNVDGLRSIVEDHDEGDAGQGEIAMRIAVTGSPAYKRAFSKYLRNQSALWSPEEARAAALAVTATTTTGGYAVPYVFDPTLLHIGVWTAQNPFRQACRTVTITNGNVWKQPTVGAVTAAYGTEASAATEQGPTFGQPSYQVQTAKAFATLSIETLEDRPDLTGELSQLFAEAKDTLEENEFAIGVGTTVHPQGMFVDTAYTNQDTATDNVTALVDFATVEGAVPLRFRQKAAWFMSRSTIRQLMVLDTTYRYFSGSGIQFPGPVNLTTGLQPGSSSGGNTGIFLLGYPIWEVPSAVSTLTTDSAIIAVLCDPQSYVIVDRIGMNVEVIPQMLNGATPSFPTLQRGVICYWRNFAKPINADAGRSLSVQ